MGSSTSTRWSDTIPTRNKSIGDVLCCTREIIILMQFDIVGFHLRKNNKWSGISTHGLRLFQLCIYYLKLQMQ
jgi:hypothetical protein